MGLIVVTGPPAAGKSTWVREHAKKADLVIDYDRIAQALTLADPTHDHAPHVRSIALEARTAAIARAMRYVGQVDVYVIHTAIPAPAMRLYRRHRTRIVTVDPGEDVVLARCEKERPEWALAVARQWYARRARASA